MLSGGENFCGVHTNFMILEIEFCWSLSFKNKIHTIFYSKMSRNDVIAKYSLCSPDFCSSYFMYQCLFISVSLLVMRICERRYFLFEDSIYFSPFFRFFLLRLHKYVNKKGRVSELRIKTIDFPFILNSPTAEN